MRPKDAIDELWEAAGEGTIKATALEYENAKAYIGNPVEIPARHSPHLTRDGDPLTGKAMLSGHRWPGLSRGSVFPIGRQKTLAKVTAVARRTDRARRKTEPEQTRPAEPKSLKPKDWLHDTREKPIDIAKSKTNELPGCLCRPLALFDKQKPFLYAAPQAYM